MVMRASFLYEPEPLAIRATFSVDGHGPQALDLGALEAELPPEGDPGRQVDVDSAFFAPALVFGTADLGVGLADVRWRIAPGVAGYVLSFANDVFREEMNADGVSAVLLPPETLVALVGRQFRVGSQQFQPLSLIQSENGRDTTGRWPHRRRLGVELTGLRADSLMRDLGALTASEQAQLAASPGDEVWEAYAEDFQDWARAGRPVGLEPTQPATPVVTAGG